MKHEISIAVTKSEYQLASWGVSVMSFAFAYTMKMKKVY